MAYGLLFRWLQEQAESLRNRLSPGKDFGPKQIPRQILSGPLRGRWLVADARTLARYRYVRGTHEPEVAEVLRSHCRPGHVVADLGAHLGYFTLLLSDLVGEGGRVHAFEPSPAPFAALTEAIALNGLLNVSAHHLAVADEPGAVAFRSVKTRSSGRISDGGDMQVPAVSFDSFLEGRRDLVKLDLVKMDVEGAELEVLRGMERTLETMRPTLLIELHERLLSRGELHTLFSLLDQHGYRVTPVGTDARRRGQRHVLASRA